MSDQEHERLSTLLESRKKPEFAVKGIHQQTNEATEDGDWRRRVEQLVTSCKDAMTKAIKRHDQLLALTLRVHDSASLLRSKKLGWRLWPQLATKCCNEFVSKSICYLQLTKRRKIHPKQQKWLCLTDLWTLQHQRPLVRDRNNCSLQNIAEKNSSVNMKVRYVVLNKNKRPNSKSFSKNSSSFG